MQNKSPLWIGASEGAFLRKGTIGKGDKKSRFIMEKPDKHNLSQVVRVSVTATSYGDCRHPWHYGLKPALCLVVSLRKTHHLCLIGRNTRQTPFERHSLKYLTSLQLSRSPKTKKRRAWHTVRNERSLRKHNNWVLRNVLDRILAQKKEPG